MTIVTKKSLFTIALLAIFILAAAPVQAHSVNKSVRVDAGETVEEASSVNGSITVGEGATVTGEVSTVNGSIRIHENAEVEDASTVNGTIRVGPGASVGHLETVNGAIRVAENVSVAGYIEAVNGAIDLRSGSTVERYIENVNGDIELVDSSVGGDLTTVSGDVRLQDGAILRGDLIVEKPSRWSWKRKDSKPEIVIGPGSRVLGTIRLEHEVELYISDTAEVGGVEGEMSMADAVRFSGDRP